jgi:hypothetical protein
LRFSAAEQRKVEVSLKRRWIAEDENLELWRHAGAYQLVCHGASQQERASELGELGEALASQTLVGFRTTLVPGLYNAICKAHARSSLAVKKRRIHTVLERIFSIYAYLFISAYLSIYTYLSIYICICLYKYRRSAGFREHLNHHTL